MTRYHRLLLTVQFLLWTSLAVLAQPANNSFANRIALNGTVVSTTGSNSGATTQGGEPNRIAGSRYSYTVWWSWTAPVSGPVRIDTAGSGFDTLLGVYTGVLYSLALVADNNNGTGLGSASLVNFNAVQGTEYKIVVASLRNGASGSIQLNLAMLPTVSITSPTNGAIYSPIIPMSLVASASSPNGSVAKVEFYRNGSLVGTAVGQPHTISVSNAPLGTNSYYAVATDIAGQTAASTAISVIHLNPGVTIVTPSDGAVFWSNSPIAVSALGFLPSGTIASVEFYADKAKFAEAPSAPFDATWSSVTAGAHVLTAVGKDTGGNLYTSAPVAIAVANTLVPTGSVWKYLDNGSDQGTAWVAPGFDDSAWASGPAELGYGDDDATPPRPPATLVGYGPDSNNRYITTYFRTSFVVTNAASYTNLVLRVLRDDGAVVYLNGTEAARYNIASGTVTYLTLATHADDDGTVYYPTNVPASLLVEGTNVLAVELHQELVTSSDISFDLDLLGIPAIVRNQAPSVNLVNPTNNAIFMNPVNVTLSGTASDADGRVALVEFFSDGTKLGSTTNSAFSFVWTNPPAGWHTLQVKATDDQGAAALSSQVGIIVYDSEGRPLVQITSPPNGGTFDGPTNLVITATASTTRTITNVQFRVNGSTMYNDTVSPYRMVWYNAAYGTNTIAAVAYDSLGLFSTSAVVTVVVIAPPTNTYAPTIYAVSPAQGSTVGVLTNIHVTFSEMVTGVNASDLLVNGVPALSVSGSGSNYAFAVEQPSYGAVAITWASAHGITDIGVPPKAFDATGAGATWSYTLADLTAPSVVSKSPAAGATVNSLSQISVTFSEPVTGVDASDLLVNGTPAFGLSGSGSNFIFSFAQPSSETVAITWALNHGITDLAPSPNAFNRSGAGATWSYTLDPRTILVNSNANWMFLKAFAEASTPMDAWRFTSFDDSGWTYTPAAFSYGDSGYTNALYPGTFLGDMEGGAYSSIYLRNQFVIPNITALTNLYLNAQSDDGFIAWINGVEVVRYNMAQGDIPYNGSALTAISEPNDNGAGWILYALTNVSSYLVNGTNTLAMHAFNNQPTTSSDFGFNAQLYTYMADASLVPPRVQSVDPLAGPVFHLTNITVRFTEPVAGVDAADLLVNGIPATSVGGGASNITYTFSFVEPAFGSVSISWASNPGILDYDSPSRAFDGTTLDALWQYNLLNPNAPVVAAQTPLAGASVSNLTQLNVVFDKPVTNVDASDLLVNGAPATGVSGGGSTFTFTFPQPSYGAVNIGWSSSHGIKDLEAPSNSFDANRSGSTWSYTLLDLTGPAVLTENPPAGTLVTNLTQIEVTFTEPVQGVNAADLLVNGVPAAAMIGSGAGPYVFSFVQPNAMIVSITWANNHGIRDLAATPNAFDANAPSAEWSYTTPDTLAPGLAAIDPPAGATVRSLTQITLTFTEPVSGVTASDLLAGGRAAQQVSGSDAGPYTFTFVGLSNGPVGVTWAANHGIADLATPPNPFAGGEWRYVIDPNANFADKIAINEIMFNPLSGLDKEEWIELHNVGAELVNLTGWHFTRGIDFTFPNVAIPGGGYLVVAADVAAFSAKYPGVTNVVGGWAGRLGNNDKVIELATVLGDLVDRVHYAAEGDWARREQGLGADLVSIITRSGSTATVRIFGTDYTAGDIVLISGADQPQYNGLFTVASPTSDSFTIPVSGSPASPATGMVVCRQVVDNAASGWSWFSAADGFGSSLELVNPLLPHNAGQNWLASTNLHGTPGAPNTVKATNVAPLILEAKHSPIVPRSSDPVTISAQVVDEKSNGVAAVTLYYRNHSITSPGAFVGANMLDDGAHQDGAAHDGVYAFTLAAQSNHAVIEFYIEAMDTSGLTRTWPAPAWQTNNTFAQRANALFQVDDESSATNMPFLRLVLTETERSQFNSINTSSDAAMNATFVSVDGDGSSVRYNSGLRLRGAGSRSGQPKNYRVNFAGDNLWNGVSELNLNCRYVHAQLAGSVLAQQAGLPCADVRVTQLRLNSQNMALLGSVNFGCYVMVEPIGAEWAANHFPLDSAGNVYRGSKYPWNANLDYLGTNAATYYGQTGAGYYKTSNRGANDWTDLFALTYALSTNTADTNYVDSVQANVNVEEWFLYFAVCNFFDYMETSLCRGVGDDYAMYRGMVDPRFRLVAHDFDTILNQGDTGGSATRSIWAMIDSPPSTEATQQATFLRRFMRHQQFAPLYFKTYKHCLDTTFAADKLNPLLDQALGSWVPAATVTAMKTFAASRRAYVLSQIPLNLTVEHSLATQSNFLFTSSASVTLRGFANIIDTRRVRVNGVQANWTAWQGRWTNAISLQPGINQILVQAYNSNDVEFARANLDIWYDDGSVQAVSGAIASDTAWTAAGGPYSVTGNLTVNAGVTLTIQAGTTIYLASGASMTVASGGKLVAEGSETAQIRFCRAPGTNATWGGITINGAVGSPETRICHATIEGNGSTAVHSSGGTLFLDHVTFGNPAVQYVSLDSSSFVVQDCVFPATTDSFEPAHGSGGIKSGGRGLFLRNFFGPITGYNDTIDFTGGNRPGPIVQFIDNVFMGSGDDVLDLDSTDAWVEGNIFMHVHKNGSPDSSSAVSGGADNADTSQVTIIGNIIYDCDHAAMAKQGDFFTLINNTIVRQSHQGGLDTNGAVVCMADEGTVEGAGTYLEGNIIYDAEKLVRNQTASIVTFTNNLMPLPWTGPGGNNLAGDPLFTHVPQLSETTNFTSWAQAQIMKSWLGLRTGSPAIGTGPNGTDKGGVSPLGASISGEPAATTSQNSATLRVGLNRAGSGIPTAGWPNGSGYTHYKWRLDEGTWSAETPIATPIVLSGLASGSHQVQVVGKRDCGFYQDDSVYGVDATVTLSRTWTVDWTASPLRLNEILASNDGVVNHSGTTPDLIELHNESASALDLAGVRLTDDPQNPDKFIFPAGATIPAGGYLVLYANNPDGTPGYHLGFNLSQQGENLYLYDAAEEGGVLLDSVSYGAQIANLSIGRLADGTWGLTVPTFGAVNQATPVGDPAQILINEWLALGQALFGNDFIELYNPQSSPVALEGMYLSDEPMGWPARHQVAALSFIPAHGYLRFLADGNPSQGADHLTFKLSNTSGMIGLYLHDLSLVDLVSYGPQWPDVSQGRTPNGSQTIAYFPQPTPGAPNPLVATTPQALVLPMVAMTNLWRYNQNGTNPGTAWSGAGYDDSSWPSGLALLAVEDCGCLPYAINTPLSLTNSGGRTITYYFRTQFVAPTNQNITSLQLSHVIDDGAVFYLNGSEILRVNMPSGTVDSTTQASSAAGDASQQGPVSISASAMWPGTNVLAVEVHQNGTASSDIVFGMSLDALVVTNANPAGSVLINEVLAANESLAEPDGSTPDWVEIYNGSAISQDLSGMSLTDDSTQPVRWVFPAGSVLPAGGFFRVLCDPNRTNTGLNINTNFALKASGGWVYLFDKIASGGSMVDSVAYGLQAAGFSIGRVPDGGTNWTLSFPTPESGNLRVTSLGDPGLLKVNEWMANPDSGSDWFEVYNPDPQPVAIGGMYLTDDLNNLTKHRIAPLSFLGTGTNAWQKFVADGNVEAGADHVSFSLKASGEALGIATPGGVLIDGVAFATQEAGVSEGRFPDGTTTLVRFPQTASPGEPNYRWLDGVVVNEVLTHSDLPFEDAIEVRNLTDQPVDLSGWWLSDDMGAVQKYQIPFGTVLPPNGYTVFYENTFSNGVLAAIPFSLSSKGDEVVLSAASENVLTGYRTWVKFGAADNGISFGRYVTSVGQEQFVAMSARSFGMDDPSSVQQFRLGAGAANPYPKVGPVVISQIMYHPPDLGTNDNVRDEYVALQNITAGTVQLFDPAYPANVWHLRDGVDFDFAPGTAIPSGGMLLVVSFDPAANAAALAAFRGSYGLDTNVAIVGPYQGKLANSGETLQLKKPGAPEAGDVPYILVDEVRYADAAPWPAEADGTGFSLHRLSMTGFGNDPTNWFAAAPALSQPDRDGDGMPDAWEDAHGFNKNDPADAYADADRDGRTNLQEYQSGTDPSDAGSILRAQVLPGGSPESAAIVFSAAANLRYAVEYTDGLNPAVWHLLQEIPAAPAPRTIEVPVAEGSSQRFYRIVTPGMP